MSTSTVPYQQNPYSPGSGSTVIQCYRCGDTCKGEVVRVQSNHFHIRCFTCQVCGCDLAQSGFFFKNQEYICTHDYQQLYGTRCDSCGDFITGEVISALGRTYHPKCFVCSTCRKPFPIGDKVTFSGKDCVCQNCSHSLISTKPIKIHGPSRKLTALIQRGRNETVRESWRNLIRPSGPENLQYQRPEREKGQGGVK
ncbi:PREDICTED: actin-binding LIM protein 3-like, partial [Tinamus guttatus]|uniref:actin-binding LIM protein 3-like n=1 Tax=Tinamus guttatus TaxID=94827 RepID=UPI00052EF48B